MLKIMKMEPWKLPRQCFQMLCTISQNGERPNWTASVKSILFQYGFSEVWLYNGQDHVDIFLQMFREIFSDCDCQNWNNQITNSPKSSFYILLKKRFYSK